jgi:hypothetical protein
MDKVTRYLAIAVTIMSAVMIYLNWDNRSELSAWIVAFTGWITYTLEVFGKKS